MYGASRVTRGVRVNETSAMAELAEWLAEIGAPECAEAMSSADVDMEVVRDLTDHDLREIGLSLGQRKRLIRGITALNEEDRRKADPDRQRAEQRQLSVLFSDLVGSTELSTKVDTEEFATILQDYHRLCSSIATQWGGRLIAQFGDGCMIIFGHPRMHEDDAERAIRAGQQMIREVSLSGPYAGEFLQSRVAVATGRVVIGDLTGVSDPDALAGQTPNLAARMQGTIDPQQLIIDRRTMRLVSHAFDLTPRGAMQLRGFSTPIEGWLVGDPHETRSRYDMLAPASVHSIFGRDAEVALLEERWQKTLGGESQVVVLKGEPGIGKSWLISAFASKVVTDTPNMRRLRLFCSSIHQNTALHPALDQLAWTAGIRADDAPETVRKRLVDYFDRQTGVSEGSDQLVAAHLLPGVVDAETRDLNAGQHKAAMFRLLHELLASELTRGPVLLEFEDAHWADPTSLELISSLANIAGDQPTSQQLMIVVTHRPDYQDVWPSKPWITKAEIGRLSMTDSIELAKTVIGDELSEARLRDIVTKADGVPLYVREIARTAAEAETDAVGGTIEVPDTLESSLIARLDRLGTVKNIAQNAAALGRQFHEQTLAEVTGMGLTDLQSGLAALVDAELITPLPDVGAGVYLFRHALIQDAAYGSLLRRERQEIHSRAATVLERDQSSGTNLPPEVLARHYAGAEMPLEAVGKLIEAGRSATSRAAQIEANNHYRRALELLANLPEDEARLSLEAMVHALLGQSLIATLGFGAPEIADSFARARTLSERTGDLGLLLSSAYGRWTVAAARGEREFTKELAAEAITLFGDSNQPLFALGGHFMDGVTKLYDKQLDAAETALNLAIENYDPALHPYLVQAFGDDLGTFAMIYVQWIRSLRGDFAGAGELTAKITEISAQLDDRQIDARNLGFATSGAQTVGAVDFTIDMANQLEAVATQQCYPHWIAVAQINRGWARCHQPDGDDGITEVNAALGFFNLIGQRTPLSLCHSVQVEALLALGRHEEALAAADAALHACDTSLDRLYDIDLRRLRGESLLPSDPSAGEAVLRAAFDEAVSSGMAYFALKSGTSLIGHLSGHPDAAGIGQRLAAVRANVTAPMPLPVVIAADAAISASGA